MSHTKRSPGFNDEVTRLAARCRDGSIGPTGILRIAEILINNTTDSSCLVKAADDEPIFVLRAKDATADGLVDLWCEAQIEERLRTNDTRPMEKIADARDCAREMRSFPNRKYPD